MLEIIKVYFQKLFRFFYSIDMMWKRKDLNYMKYLAAKIVIIFIVFFKFSVAKASDVKITIFSANKTSEYSDLLEASKSSLISTLSNNYELVDGNELLKNIDFEINEFNLIEKYPLIKNILNSEIIIILKLKIFSDKYNDKYFKIVSNIFDTNSNSFINSWSTPTMKVQFKENCDSICEKVALTEKIVLQSVSLGNDFFNYFSSIFDDYLDKKTYSNKYSIKLLNLGKVNNERVIDLLINEFPGFIEPIKINSDYYQLWTYSTPVNHKKITKWFRTIIKNLNKSHKNTLELLIQNKKITIQK